MILNLPFIFLIAFLIGVTSYALSSYIAPKKDKESKNNEKFELYACGERLPTKNIEINIQRFFFYLVLFLIFDITAFILSLSYTALSIYPVIFIIFILWTITIIIPVIGGKKK